MNEHAFSQSVSMMPASAPVYCPKPSVQVVSIPVQYEAQVPPPPLSPASPASPASACPPSPASLPASPEAELDDDVLDVEELEVVLVLALLEEVVVDDVVDDVEAGGGLLLLLPHPIQVSETTAAAA
jgi:hypothetical protein